MDAIDAFRKEHATLLEHVDHLRVIAADLPRLAPVDREKRKEMALDFLRGMLVPHAEAEEKVLYPVVAEILGHPESTAPMVREHRAIVARIEALAETDTEDIARMQELLYGLHALLTVHFHQEEEDYLPLLEKRPAAEISALFERLGHAHEHVH